MYIFVVNLLFIQFCREPIVHTIVDVIFVDDNHSGINSIEIGVNHNNLHCL